MGAKKFSLDNQYELEDLFHYLDNMTEAMDINLSLTQMGDKKPSVELTGTFTTAELKKILDQRRLDLYSTGQKDVLTGVLSREYFEKRMSTIDRSQVLPVAVVNININDWKFHNDNYGDEQSDRLIKIIANIIQSEAKADFVVGRINGDIFGVLIPMAEDGEAEFFATNVKNRCMDYEDDILAPSVAVGIVYKTNIEQKLEDLMSDAEYAMFEDKFEVKNGPKYKRRLEHGIKPYHPDDK